MNNYIVVLFIIIALGIGVGGGYYYAHSKVDVSAAADKTESQKEGLDQGALEAVNPFSETNVNNNPFEYVNPFE